MLDAYGASLDVALWLRIDDIVVVLSSWFSKKRYRAFKHLNRFVIDDAKRRALRIAHISPLGQSVKLRPADPNVRWMHDTLLWVQIARHSDEYPIIFVSRNVTL